MTVSWNEFARLASAPVTVALRGRVHCADAPAERVLFAPPDRWRVETDDGRLRYLATDAGYFQWRPGSDGVACFQPRRPGFWQSGGVSSTDLVRPRDLVHPTDDDFTRAAGPVEELTVFGRPAWRVLLAPPKHKPKPVWQTVDVRSGVTLAFETPDGRPLIEFTELSTGLELPAETFTVPAGHG